MEEELNPEREEVTPSFSGKGLCWLAWLDVLYAYLLIVLMLGGDPRNTNGGRGWRGQGNDDGDTDNKKNPNMGFIYVLASTILTLCGAFFYCAGTNTKCCGEQGPCWWKTFAIVDLLLALPQAVCGQILLWKWLLPRGTPQSALELVLWAIPWFHLFKIIFLIVFLCRLHFQQQHAVVDAPPSPVRWSYH